MEDILQSPFDMAAAYDDEVKGRVEQVMRRKGRSLDDLDLSDQACLTLMIFYRLMNDIPGYVMSDIAKQLRVPSKQRKDQKRTIGWILQHWYRTDVQGIIKRLVEFVTDRPLFDQPVLIEAELQRAINTRHIPWTILASSAYNSPDPLAIRKCRHAYGEVAWDVEIELMRASVKPALFVLLTHPFLKEALEQERDARVREKLEGQVRSLSWEADEAKSKHEKATKTVGNLAEENRQLRQELEHEKARYAELEAELLEQRQFFGEFTAVMHEIQARQATAIAQGKTEAVMPLSGQQVAVVGGDPIHQFVASVIDAMGGESRLYSGTTKIQQLSGAAAPDLLVVITTYLTHSHDAHIKVLRHTGVPVVFVNQKGIGAVRRSLLAHLDEKAARSGKELVAAGVAEGRK